MAEQSFNPHQTKPIPIGGYDPANDGLVSIRATNVTYDATNDVYYGDLAGTGGGSSTPTTSTASTPSLVNASTSSVQLLAANSNRTAFSVYNNGTANLYIALAATATTSAFLAKLLPGDEYVSTSNPLWQGIVSGIWDVANGNAVISEETGTAGSSISLSATANETSVGASTSSVSLLASNSLRKGFAVFNNGTANLFLAYGATASLTAFKEKVGPGELYEMPTSPIWLGAVSGIWDVANGRAIITEEV